MLAQQVVVLCAVAGILLPSSVLGEITENATVQVELSSSEVDEGDGSVTACAVYSGLEGPTGLFLGSIGAASATPADRYGQIDFENVAVTLTLNDTEGRVCINISIVDDRIIENTEVFSVLAQINATFSVLENVAIIDNDGSFAFDQAHYTVSESAGSIRVCANLDVPFFVQDQLTLETDLKLFAVNETRELVAAPVAIAGQDYTQVNQTFTASFLTRRRCINIPILDDSDREPNERFAVILRVTRSLAARDFQAVASVEIQDDDSGPLSISFINNTPRVFGNTVTVVISLSRRTRFATCRLDNTEVEDCFTGTFFRDVPPGQHTIRIEAMNNIFDRAAVTRKIKTGSGFRFCSTHLINDGVTVDGSTVTVEFGSAGPALRFTCQLDFQRSFSCRNPVALEDVGAGLHRLRITAEGGLLCSTSSRQVIRFIVPRQ